jgi:hypothetical protein
LRIRYYWADVFPEAVELLKHAPDTLMRSVVSDNQAYWREFSRDWDGSSDLMTIEHDVGLHADVVPDFEACDDSWCWYDYQAGPHGASASGLGCTRFSAEIQRAVPAGVIEAGHREFITRPNPARCPDCHPLHWSHVNVSLFRTLRAYGYTPHQHTPPCAHFKTP